MIAGLAAVIGNTHTAVRAGHHAVGILTVDPEGAKVAKGPTEDPVSLRAGKPRPGFAAIFGTGDGAAGDENSIGVVRIDAQLIKSVTCFSADVVSRRIHFAPGRTTVIGAVYFAANQSLASSYSSGLRRRRRFGGFVSIVDHRVENVWILLIKIQTDSSNHTRG